MDEPRNLRRRDRDRLSELPDSLVLEILSLLQMRDVVRSTILSKRWKDLWTTVPCLNFCGEYSPSFIDGALAKWNGAKILKFCIRTWLDDYDPPSNENVDSWLLVAIDKQVEELHLYIDMDPEYCAPQRVYSCSSVTKLFLDFCDLIVDENVQLHQHKSLTIEQPTYLSEDAINRILSGAPLLEELELLYWDVSEYLDIQSSSLKRLKINMFDHFLGNASLLKICAPNLESLELSGVWPTRCLFNVPSLASARLDFYHQFYLNEPSRYTLVEEMFRQAFISLSHVEKLTLNECSIEFLVDQMEKDKDVIFPKLTMLIVELHQYCGYSLFNENESLAPKTIFSDLSLLQLKTIVITWDSCDDSILPVVEILLENARALEKLVLRLRNHEANPEMFILAEEKVLSMRRASTNSKVIISKYR